MFLTSNDTSSIHGGRSSEETMPSDVELTSKNLLGDNSIVVPPDPIPNSEVKRNRADGSVGSPHVRVGHRQAPNLA